MDAILLSLSSYLCLELSDSRQHIEKQAAGRIDTWSCIELVRGLVWMTERSLYRFSIEPGRDREAFIRALREIWLRALYGRSS